MASFIKSFRRFMRTQGRSYWRYDRLHPHFTRSLAIVALLSVISVTGAVTLATANSNATRQDLIRRSGAQTLTTVELTDLIVNEKLVAYWLGPISGSRYTIVATQAGIVTISYFSGGHGIDVANQRNLVIKTVTNIASKGALLAYNSEVNNAQDSTVTGNTFSYNVFLLDHMTVQIQGSGYHVHVFYPQTRSALTMQTDAEAMLKIG